MARIYTNENFRYSVVLKLREFGHDVLTVQEAGNANQRIPDEEVLEFAIKENRILLTLNRKDFIRLHKLNQNHAGIIVCSLDFQSERQAISIHEMIMQNEPTEGKLIRVNKPNR